jgi:hypothetical protein
MGDGIDEFGRLLKKCQWFVSGHYHNIFVEGLRKTVRTSIMIVGFLDKI